MEKLSGNAIRQLWLQFFIKHNHKEIPSVPLIPLNDPTLLWINSGVAGLKQYFDGRQAPPAKALVNCQKAIRTNDIEIVGSTARHHTFFEMLGNFSIGGYFRQEAITLAFEFLTSPDYLNLDIEKLYFTYYPDDLETKNCWLALGIKEEHLISCPGNFWEIGEGPCGPDSEVFYDRGIKYDKDNVGTRLIADEIENERFVEIWNIVFSQYAAEEGKQRSEYKQLPQKNIDTGAGLERITAIIQEAETNFETDLFMPIIKTLEQKTNINYQSNKKAFFIIADHIRSVTFALADGAVFSSNARGYVLRRLLRRACRYLMQLGVKESYLYQLVPVVIAIMKDYYTYLPSNQERIMDMIKAEEANFQKTLKRGYDLLISSFKNNKLSGEDAFKLYDTYGFPIELTLEVAQEEGAEVDLKTYQKLMEKQKEQAHNALNKEDSLYRQDEQLLNLVIPSKFIDNVFSLTAKVQKIIQKDNQLILVFDQTCFYASSGGQVCDQGVIFNDHFNAEVGSVIKAPHGQHLHVINNYQGVVNENDLLTLKIDQQKRQLAARNHSATHLLQAVLIEMFNNSIHQAGSEVDSQRLRFDFTFNRKLQTDELIAIENRVNQIIAAGGKTAIALMPLTKAQEQGALFLAQEKYPDIVRFVNLGGVSKELCGGTHVSDVNEIGVFVIIGESSIAAGVRRIEARTSYHGYKYLKEKDIGLERIKHIVKSSGDIISDINDLQGQLKEVTNQLALVNRQVIKQKLDTATIINPNYNIAILEEDNYNLNAVADIAKNDVRKSWILVNSQGNIIIIVGQTAFEKEIDAVKILKQLALKGGGHSRQAQGKGIIDKDHLISLIRVL